MEPSLTYPKTPRNTVNRLNKRGTYDLSTVHSILNSTLVSHVSFAPSPTDPFPAILPMIAALGSHTYPSSSLDEPQDIYLHGYVSSRIMRLARDSEAGVPVCICATRVDGLVLSLTPNSHSYNYRSAMVHGYARVVEGEEEKGFAMRLITEKVLAGRWEGTRVPPDSAEMQSTVILRVEVVDGSAKVRSGEPHDDRKDTEREEVVERVWTGVVPVWEVLGEPVGSRGNRVREVPEYVKEFVREGNERSEKYAKGTTVDPE